MCENFVCLELAAPDRQAGSTGCYLPEPCYEHINCQICELMYNCDYCASNEKCRQIQGKVLEKQKTAKNAARRSH
jgi:hypothetical protein